MSTPSGNATAVRAARGSGRETLTEDHSELLDILPHQVVCFDRSGGEIKYCNARYAAVYGRVPVDLIGHPVVDFIGTDAWRALASLVGPLSAERPEASVETTWPRPDRSRLVEFWTLRLRPSRSGRSTILAVGQDITRLSAAERASREKEENFRLLLTNLPVPAIVYTSKGVVFVNGAAAELLGAEHPNDLIGADPRSLVPSPVYLPPVGRVPLAVGQMGPFRVKVPHAAGERHIDLLVTEMDLDGTPARLMVGSDVTAQVTALEAGAQVERLQRFLTDNCADVLMRVGSDGLIDYVAGSAQRLLGSTVEDLTGADVLNVIHDSHRERVTAAMEASLLGGGREHLEVLALPAAGDASVWVHVTVTAVTDLRDPTGGTVEYHVTLSDITDRKILEDAVRSDRLLLDATLNHVHASVVVVDTQGNVLYMNDTGAVLRRSERGETSINVHHDRPYSMELPDGQPLSPQDEPFRRALAGLEVNGQHLVIRWPDRPEIRHVSASALPMCNTAGHQVGAVGVLHDITPLKRAEDAMRHLAYHDPLTGLPNRRRLVEALTSALVRNARHPDRMALLFCDLDGFKNVNDSYGHDAGDELLTAVAERLRSAVRASDLVARIGGDEFVIIFEPIMAPLEANAIAVRLEELLAQQFPLTRAVVSSGGSVGWAVPSNGMTTDELLNAADRAMYLRKRARTLGGIG